jgi:PAS domain-containing protein
MSTPLSTDRPPFSTVAEAHEIPAAAIDGLLEHIPVGVMVVDRDGQLVYANAAARALRIERLDRLQWGITRALLTEDEVREDDIDVVVTGEPRRFLSAYITPLRTAGLGVNAAFVVVSDVTARKRMAAWTPMIETLVNL